MGRGLLARFLDALQGQPLQLFHNYSFAVIRQLGSSAECAASYLRWLEARGERGLLAAAEALEALSSSAKALQFRVARAVTHKKPWDPGPSLAAMAESWDTALGLVVARYG